MFKNATIFRLGAAWAPNLHAFEQAASAAAFAPCGPTQQSSIGFVPPRGKDSRGAMVEAVGGQWIVKVKVETRNVPTQTLNKRVDELAAQVEEQTGRKPGKKHRKELKEQALLDLLPQAFSKEVDVLVWIDPIARLLVLDTASASRADAITTLLVRAVEGLVIEYVATEVGPAAVMTAWLHDGDKLTADDRFGFEIDRECELVSTDELRSVVRYGKHPLDVDNVREHITAGKVARKLALTWNARVSFVLTDGLQLRKINFLDLVFEGNGGGSDDAFDNDVSILTGELGRLLPNLLDAMGGEVVVKEGGAA